MSPNITTYMYDDPEVVLQYIAVANIQKPNLIKMNDNQQFSTDSFILY